MELDFRGLTEDAPGDAWRAVVSHGWPGWRQWFRGKSDHEPPRLNDARRALRRHMPEMERLWDQLVEAADGDDEFAVFLSFWMPPRYLVGCSQLVLHGDDGPALIRNYDLDPTLNESTMLNSAWRRQRVMGMVEGLVGLADGMNQSGLAASLAFGGRTQSGRGFGIPLIMRYVLEMCRDARDAREALRTVPCHMSYNVTVADRGGDWATVFLAPDRPAVVSDNPFATNHQIGVEWPYYARITHTQRRAEHLDAMRYHPPAQAEAEFLQAPLFSTGYNRGFGTVYTASYRPASGKAWLSWKDGQSLEWDMMDFTQKQASIRYDEAGSHLSHRTPRSPLADGLTARFFGGGSALPSYLET